MNLQHATTHEAMIRSSADEIVKTAYSMGFISTPEATEAIKLLMAGPYSRDQVIRINAALNDKRSSRATNASGRKGYTLQSAMGIHNMFTKSIWDLISTLEADTNKVITKRIM